MNALQARALGALYDDIERLTGRTGKDLHLGDGSRAVSLEVTDESDGLEAVVGEDGWQTVTVWCGGRGACMLLDNDGVLYGDTGDDEWPPRATLTYDDDARRFGWDEVAA